MAIQNNSEKKHTVRPLSEVITDLGIRSDEYIPYGWDKAKLRVKALNERLADEPQGKLVLVTAINPTPAGEGKTTITIGLGQALHATGHRSLICLREPSLGPVFGVKGGATGGGEASITPMESINLHFTGDIGAITAANNLAAAVLDNHIYQGNELNIDPTRIFWKRCLDMNDRALRNIVIGLGGRANGVPREDHWQISVASEVMAVFCLSKNRQDLRERLGKMVVAFTYDNKPVTTADLKVDGAMAALLVDAFDPNLVQSLNGSPVLVHGGPFANIAHGSNSIAATRLALKLGDIVVTEAGFGADLGAEKFVDITSRAGEFAPQAIVIVATVRALKYNGGVARADLDIENVEAMLDGTVNLVRHIENLRNFAVPVTIAINRFPSDTEAELKALSDVCTANGVTSAVVTAFTEGGDGCRELLGNVLEMLDTDEPRPLTPLYDLSLSYRDKLDKIAKTIYGAGRVDWSKEALRNLRRFERAGYKNLPICVAKTQYSLSDDPTMLGAPKDYVFTVRDVQLSAGAGFIVCLAGEIMTMPGLPPKPAAEDIEIDGEQILGIF